MSNINYEFTCDKCKNTFKYTPGLKMVIPDSHPEYKRFFGEFNSNTIEVCFTCLAKSILNRIC